MGFLDHTTNNIIIDAVLTERGRELLARNDGSFRIDSFAFGDDEIDYSNIIKYGLNIGKEKIEKNTPIFEAQTNENLALKHNLITLSSSTTRILYIPVLAPYQNLNITNNVLSPLVLTLNTSGSNVKNQTFQILSTIPASANQIAIDSNITDLRFEVKMNSLLLSLYSIANIPTTDYIDLDENYVATYQVAATRNNISDSSLNSPHNYPLINRQLLELNIGIQQTKLNANSFKKFGNLSNDGLTGSIDTYVEIIGLGSGSRILIPFKIQLS